MTNSKSRGDNEELRRAAANGLVETVEKLLALKAGKELEQLYSVGSCLKPLRFKKCNF